MPILPNIFIVGCGRNGTSMVAGLFAKHPFFMGEKLHAPRDSNPKGFFEDAAINQLNDSILSRYTPERTVINGFDYQCDAPGRGQHWLARVPTDVVVTATPEELLQIRHFVERSPFCYKDTRFCYTLHLWQGFASNAKYICVFRPPNIAVESILKECHSQPYLADFSISVNQAYEVWYLMYSHIVERFSKNGDWLFVKYEDVVTGGSISRIEEFTSLKIDDDFPEQQFSRTKTSLIVPDKVSSLYDKLLFLSKN